MGIYNRTYEILGLHNDLNSRIIHVSQFTTATEREYDRLASGFQRSET